MDAKKLKVGQEVFLASERLIEEGEMTRLPFVVLPATIEKVYASPNAPTCYVRSVMNVVSGPWQTEHEVFETEREAFITGFKIATKKIEEITRESQSRVQAILRCLDGHGPSIISKL